MKIDYRMCACGQLYYPMGGKANGSIMKHKISQYIDENTGRVSIVVRPQISHGIMCQYGLELYMGSKDDARVLGILNPKFSELEEKCKTE